MSPNPDPSTFERLPGLWAAYQQLLRGATYTDLTHAFFPGQPHFPAFPDQTFGHFVSLDDGALFEVHQYGFVGQWGTHVDPPSHMVAGGRTISELKVNEMLLPLCVLNVSEQVKTDPDYRPTLADLEDWEKKYGRVPEGSFVALRTDWYRRWPDRERMANADAEGISHFPGWSSEVLEVLLKERGVVAVGHETTDTDGGISSTRDGDYSLEAYILGRDCWQLELLANLDNVPEVGALLLASWPNPRGGSGFPARAVAISP
ncbi:cyclase family protein [Deinococcus rubellus]|uniref:cyclase family protein n=1 Tax=Deinococcus rubellus TaxID=1889240 RepID=UPI0031EEBA35